MKIIVLGAAGFLGKLVVRRLSNDGHEVLAIARNAERVEIGCGVRALSHDLLDPEIEGVFLQFMPDIVINTAWDGVFGADRNHEKQFKNVLAAINISNACVKSGVRRFVGLGSQAEYGLHNSRISEENDLMPTTLYGKCKVASFHIHSSIFDKSSVEFTWLRLFSTYGPQDNPGWFIPYVMRQALLGRSAELTNCEQIWDYLYIDDVVDAVVSSSLALKSGVYNLASGVDVPLRKIVDSIYRICGATCLPKYGAIPYRPDQVMSLTANTEKINSELGWYPKITLDTGLVNVFNDMRNVVNV